MRAALYPHICLGRQQHGDPERSNGSLRRRCSVGVDEPTRNGRVFVEVVAGADAVIAVSDDQRCSGSRADEQDWGELLASGDFRQASENRWVGLWQEVDADAMRV
jgi:hypothetical protein